jgi:hypothetical protein
MELTEPHASLFRDRFEYSADLGSVMSLWAGSLATGLESELEEGAQSNVA